MSQNFNVWDTLRSYYLKHIIKPVHNSAHKNVNQSIVYCGKNKTKQKPTLTPTKSKTNHDIIYVSRKIFVANLKNNNYVVIYS